MMAEAATLLSPEPPGPSRLAGAPIGAAQAGAEPDHGPSSGTRITRRMPGRAA